MYVWFDALVSYISALGWPQAEKKFEEFWVGGEPLQFAGKDNLRQQAAMWPAMLLSAGLPPARQIVIHGFITNDGQKMSKSLGNVINPLELVEEYGSEALRYFLLRHVHPFEDSDVTAAKFKEVYNSHLANGLGNLLSRVIKMAAEFEVPPVETVATIDPAVLNYLTRFEFGLALDFIWRQVSELNGLIQETQPFKTIKTEPERARADVAALLAGLAALAANLVPALPATAAALTRALQTHHLPAPLFPRKD
jgi:methionyl-tRNA synthetase